MALEERLRARSLRGGPSLIRLRKSVVFDRLLARLLVVAPDHWVLKGALALDYRFGNRTRTTKDIDLGREDDEQAATADFIKAQSTELDDHFVFVVEKVGRLGDLDDATAVRYHVACELAGRPCDDINVDIAFGNPQIYAPELVRGPELLDFADIEPVEVPAIPLSQHVARRSTPIRAPTVERGEPALESRTWSI
jgi:nucleotidyltransferase AbiEii toxin of type IV toxin-antitoxin system